MITGKTGSGFEFQIEEDALNDYEVLEGLRGIDKGDMLMLVDTIDLLLGQDQVLKLKAHLKAFDGRVKMDAMIRELEDILTSNNSTKKS